MELGEYRKAGVYLTELLEKDLKNPEAHYLLGECLCKLQEFDKAITQLHFANTLLPRHPQILELLGWAYFMNGDSEKGRELMGVSLALAPNEIQTLCDLSVLEMKEGNEKAYEYAEKALKIAPKNEMVKDVFLTTNKFLKTWKQIKTKSQQN